MQNTFDFVGRLYVPVEWANTYDKESGTTKKIRFAVQPQKNNSEFVQVMGWKSKNYDGFGTVIKNKDGNYKWGNVKYKDRFDPEVIKDVSFSHTYQTNVSVDNLGLKYGDRKTKTFIHKYDLVEYLKDAINEVLEENPNQMFKVQGEVEPTLYNGKYYVNYNVKNMWLSDETEGYLETKLDIYYTKGSLDDAGVDLDEKYYLDGYIAQYDSDTKGDLFYPVKFVYPVVKEDGDSLDKKRQQLNLKALSANIKKDDVFHQGWLVNVFNGAPVVQDITIDDLTEQQRLEVEAGLADIEDFAETSFGENVSELRLVRYLLTGDFKNGRIKSPMLSEEFEEKIARSKMAEDKTDKQNQDFIDDALGDLDADLEDDLESDLPF